MRTLGWNLYSIFIMHMASSVATGYPIPRDTSWLSVGSEVSVGGKAGKLIKKDSVKSGKARRESPKSMLDRLNKIVQNIKMDDNALKNVGSSTERTSHRTPSNFDTTSPYSIGTEGEQNLLQNAVQDTSVVITHNTTTSSVPMTSPSTNAQHLEALVNVNEQLNDLNVQGGYKTLELLELVKEIYEIIRKMEKKQQAVIDDINDLQTNKEKAAAVEVVTEFQTESILPVITLKDLLKELKDRNRYEIPVRDSKYRLSTSASYPPTGLPYPRALEESQDKTSTNGLATEPSVNSSDRSYIDIGLSTIGVGTPIHPTESTNEMTEDTKTSAMGTGLSGLDPQLITGIPVSTTNSEGSTASTQPATDSAEIVYNIAETIPEADNMISKNTTGTTSDIYYMYENISEDTTGTTSDIDYMYEIVQSAGGSVSTTLETSKEIVYEENDASATTVNTTLVPGNTSHTPSNTMLHTNEGMITEIKQSFHPVDETTAFEIANTVLTEETTAASPEVTTDDRDIILLNTNTTETSDNISYMSDILLLAQGGVSITTGVSSEEIFHPTSDPSSESVDTTFTPRNTTHIPLSTILNAYEEGVVTEIKQTFSTTDETAAFEITDNPTIVTEETTSTLPFTEMYDLPLPPVAIEPHSHVRLIPFKSHDHTQLLVILSVGALALLMVVVGVGILCYIHGKKKNPENIYSWYTQARYKEVSPLD